MTLSVDGIIPLPLPLHHPPPGRTLHAIAALPVLALRMQKTPEMTRRKRRKRTKMNRSTQI